MKNRRELEILLDELEVRLQKANEEYLRCPEGRLHQARRGGKDTFFQVTASADGKRIRKVITTQPDMVKLLVRKEYLKTEIAVLTENQNLLHKLLSRYTATDGATILQRIPQRFRKLPEDWFWFGCSQHALSEEADRWAAAPFRQSDYMPEKKTKRTSRGLMVRTMAEVVYAERFYYHNIPFHYEEVLEIDGIAFAPDFTLKRRRDGKLFYWEHCGLPHIPKYLQKHKWKLEMYEKAGIVPWDNLIVTYGDQDSNVDVRIIESEILHKLL